MKNTKNVKCITLSVDCMSATAEEQALYGVNSWGFDFFVRMEDAQELMLHTVNRFAEFHLPQLNIKLGLPITVSESNVWTKEAIDACINNNLGFLKEAQESTRKIL